MMRTARLTPYLAFHDCVAAIRFYQETFGAVETGTRYADADGRIGHAEIAIGGETVFVSDEYPDYGACSPKTLGDSHVALHPQAVARRLAPTFCAPWRSNPTASVGTRSGTAG